MNIVHLAEFWLDIAEAAAWYDKRLPGLGAELAIEISATVDKIIASPDRHRNAFGEVRTLLTGRFPYAVLYLIDGDTLVFVGVKHGARDLTRFLGDRLDDA